METQALTLNCKQTEIQLNTCEYSLNSRAFWEWWISVLPRKRGRLRFHQTGMKRLKIFGQNCWGLLCSLPPRGKTCTHISRSLPGKMKRHDQHQLISFRVMSVKPAAPQSLHVQCWRHCIQLKSFKQKLLWALSQQPLLGAYSSTWWDPVVQ